MRLFIILIILSTTLKLSAETGQQFFSENVHPILTKRCWECHGIDQKPYHSISNSNDAYQEAKKTININFPQESSLWQRSYNGHCGKPNLCGFQDENFKTQILTWINIEAQEKSYQLDPLNLVAKTMWNPDLNEEIIFNLENGSTLSFKTEKLDDQTWVIKDPKWEKLTEGMHFEGFEIRSPHAFVKFQNFASQAWVFKPSINPLRFIDFNMIPSTYIILDRMDSQNSLELELWFKSIKMDLSILSLNEAFQAGFSASIDQAYFSKIKNMFSSLNGQCASFDSGEIKCWGENYYSSEHIGDEPDEMKYIKPIYTFPKEDKIKQVATFRKRNWNYMMEIYLTDSGKVFYFDSSQKNGDDLNKKLLMVQIPLPAIEYLVTARSDDYSGQEFICFAERTGVLHCLTSEPSKTPMDSQQTLLTASEQSEIPLEEEIFIVDTTKDPILSIELGPQAYDDKQTNIIFYKSGRLKLVYSDLISDFKENSDIINQNPYLELKNSKPILNIMYFKRNIGNNSEGLLINYGDSLLPFYYKTNLPDGGSALNENIEAKINRLKTSPHVLFPPGEKLKKMVLGTDILCLLFVSGRFYCVPYENITDDYSLDYNKRTLVSAWKQDQVIKNPFVIEGPYENDVNDIFNMQYDTFCATLKSSEKLLCFGSKEASFTPNSKMNQFIFPPNLKPQKIEETDLVNIGTNLKVKSYFEFNYMGCFVFTNGRAKCFGNNGYGDLGFGDKKAHHEIGDERDFLPLQAPSFLTPDEENQLELLSD